MKIKNNNFIKSGFDASSKLTGKLGNKPVKENQGMFVKSEVIEAKSFDQDNHTDEVNYLSEQPVAYKKNKELLLPPKEKQVLTNYNNVIVELDNKEQQIVQYLFDKLNTESDIETLQIILATVNSTLEKIRDTKAKIQMSIYNIQDKLEQE